MTASMCHCLGCSTFCRSGTLASGEDAHRTRLLLALDHSVAAACRDREIAACDGIEDGEACDIGDLHTKTAALAKAIADLIAHPELADAHGTLEDRLDRITDAAEALAVGLHEAAVARGPRWVP